MADALTCALKGFYVCNCLASRSRRRTPPRHPFLIVLVVVLRPRLRIVGRGYKAGRFTCVGQAALSPPPDTDTFLPRTRSLAQ